MKIQIKTKRIKIILKAIGTVLLLIFTAPFVSGIHNIGNLLGTALSLVIILCSVALDKIIAHCRKISEEKIGRILLRTALAGATAVSLCFSVALCSVLVSSTTNASTQDTVIVLGCGVYGTNPSRMLRYRINSAYDYLIKNPDSVAVLSGGQGRGESISEAQCMFNVLTDMGIDADRLYLEDRSTNTYENITFSMEIIEKNSLSSDIAIASSDFHLKRATMIAKKQGINAKRISAWHGFLLGPTYYVRDTLGVIKEFIF